MSQSHFDDRPLKILAKKKNWSRQKLKSIRGQLLAMDEESRKAYMAKVMNGS